MSENLSCLHVKEKWDEMKNKWIIIIDLIE